MINVITVNGTQKLRMMDTDKCYGRCMGYNDRRRGYEVSGFGISGHYAPTRSTMAVRHQVLQKKTIFESELWV